MGRRGAAFVLASLTLATTVVFTTAEPAPAWRETGWGCRFHPSDREIGVWISSGVRERRARYLATRDAIRAWNDTTIPYHFVVIRRRTDPRVDLRVVTGYRERLTIASMTMPCGWRADRWASDPVITWNLGYRISSYPRWLRGVAASHELGHALGLAHQSVLTCDRGVTGIMHRNLDLPAWCGWRGPTRDDVRGVKAVARR